MEMKFWFLGNFLPLGYLWLTGFFVGVCGCLLLAALVVRFLKRTAGPGFLPGVQCNRLAFLLMAFKHLWTLRKNDYIFLLGIAMYGTGTIFQKEGVFRLWRDFRSLVMICNAEMAEAFLHTSENNPKAQEYEYLKPWLEDGLLLSKGKKWRYRRKLLTPAFHFRILEQFLFTMNKYSKEFADVLEKESKRGWVKGLNPMSRCTLDILCESIMGISIGALHDPNNSYLTALPKLSESIFSRLVNPLYWWDFLYKYTLEGQAYNRSLKFVQAFHRKVIDDRKNEILKNPDLLEKLKSSLKEESLYKSKKPFLDLMLAQHIFLNSLSENDIEEEVSTFMFEGHDTTAVGLAVVFFFLATNPRAQKMVHEEVDEVFSPNKDRDLDAEDLKRLIYTERVIKESLRLFPPVPLIGRIIGEQTNLNGYILPAGASAALLINSVQRDPRYFPEPDKFNPDNFLPEECAKRHPYAYIPFSGGSRNCIGQRFAQMELRTVVATVMSRLCVTSRHRMDEVLVRAETTVKPKPDIELCFIPRSGTLYPIY